MQWQIVAPRLCEVLGDVKTFREMMTSDHPAKLVELLAIPTFPPPLLLPRTTSWDSKRPKRFCSFEFLPPELLDMILIQLNDYEDAFCLALASRYFWHVSRPYIQMFLMNSAPHYDCDSQYFGSWEGERLICINERTDSYPSRLVPRAAYIPRPEKLMRVSEEDYSTAGWQGLPRLQRVKYFMLATLPEPERSQAFDLAAKPLGNLTKKAFLPNDRVWILRNLSTQEYVRADKFAKSPGQIDGPHIKPFGFGEILCSRICWSSKHLPRGINRGVWAGHRLDITTLDRWTKSGRSSKEGKNPEGWKDISEEVAKDMDEIWSSLFG